MPRKRAFVRAETVRWITVEEAAEFMGTNALALRARLRRAARRAPDGVVEADVDGIRGRKLGNSWRVVLGARWLEPS